MNIFMLYFICFATVVKNISSATETESFSDTKNRSDDSASKYDAQLQTYRNVFKLKRSQQMEAAERIIKMQDYSKQYKLINVLMTKIFKVLEDARVELMSSGYIPGEKFPEEEKHKEALGNVIENTVFFGDILLRSPDITYKIFLKNPEWKLASLWSISFTSESGILDKMDSKLLDLMKQELRLAPRDPTYVNPYSEKNKAKKVNESKLKGKEKKKERKKRKKGPKLSGHVEL